MTKRKPVDPDARKRKFFGQISYEYEKNADPNLTEDDFKKSVEKRIKEYCQHDEDTYYIIFHVVYHSNYIIAAYNTGALALMGCFQFPLIITAIFHC